MVKIDLGVSTEDRQNASFCEPLMLTGVGEQIRQIPEKQDGVHDILCPIHKWYSVSDRERVREHKPPSRNASNPMNGIR